MKNKPHGLFFLFLISFFALASLPAEPLVRIVQPYENSRIPYVKESFVFGSVTPATATLTINGLPVYPHTNGGFLAMIPFGPGRFKIEAVAHDGVMTSTTTRYVHVATAPTAFLPGDSQVAVLSPRGKWVGQAGDTLEVGIQGPPGWTAHFRFASAPTFLIPLPEQPGSVRGLYKTSYRIRADDQNKEDDILFTLRKKDGRVLRAKASAKITVLRQRAPLMGEIRESTVVLTGPGSEYGYNLFVDSGTRVEITGEREGFVRVSLGQENQGWVRRDSLGELEGVSSLPLSVSRNARIYSGSDATMVEIPLQHKHAWHVEQSIHPSHRLRLTLYGVIADSDRVRFGDKGAIVKNVQWFQSGRDTVEFQIDTADSHAWGYDVRYVGTTLLVELRHRPSVSTKRDRLDGLKVAVDAGHSEKSYGTIGPLANTEFSVCFAVAQVVKAELEKQGAEVVLINDGTKELSLLDRTHAAWNARAHLFISLHADACGEGQNPFHWQGYSVHYYHPQSRAWAELVHDAYGKETGYRDQGLWRSNLAVCRTTRMPSLLLEQAFLIVPEYEEKLLSEEHRKKVAHVVVKSLLKLFGN